MNAELQRMSELDSPRNKEKTTKILMQIVYNSNNEIISMLPYMNLGCFDEFELSEREQDVLNLLVEGHSYKMIADHLFIAMDTVRSHIRKIYKKLNVNSKSEAVSKTLRHKQLTL